MILCFCGVFCRLTLLLCLYLGSQSKARIVLLGKEKLFRG